MCFHNVFRSSTFYAKGQQRSRRGCRDYVPDKRSVNEKELHGILIVSVIGLFRLTQIFVREFKKVGSGVSRNIRYQHVLD